MKIPGESNDRAMPYRRGWMVLLVHGPLVALLGCTAEATRNGCFGAEHGIPFTAQHSFPPWTGKACLVILFRSWFSKLVRS